MDPRWPARMTVGALAAAAALSVPAGVVVSEVGLRSLDPAALEDTPVRHPYVRSERYGWELRRGTYRGRRGERIVVNRRGYRGPEDSLEPPPGRRRVLMLGDSIAFGTGVSEGETFSEVLESTAAFDVVNLGVEGYGTDQALLRLDAEGLAFRPREVVLHFCLRNDDFDNSLAVSLYDGATPKPYFTLEAGRLLLHDSHLRLGTAARSALALRQESYLLNALLRPFRPALVGKPAVEEHDWARRRAALLPELPRARALTARLVQEMAARCAAAGARLTVLVHPDRRSFAGESALVPPLAGPPGVRVLDLAAEYRRRGLDYEPLTLDGIGHLSPEGHRVVAEILRALLS